jgi:hypothetical protein
MKTLLLDRTTWDLVADASGNIAVASDPYSKAQDAASAIKLFSGELWYDTTKGVPYFSQILGRSPSLQLMRQYFVTAALTVPGVIKARVFFTSVAGRNVTGQVQVTDKTGSTTAAGF